MNNIVRVRSIINYFLIFKLQINNEKFLFGESDPNGSNWNATRGWARGLEGTTFDVHSAQTISVIPRHYFFHSFTGNTVKNAGFDPTHDLYKPVVSLSCSLTYSI